MTVLEDRVRVVDALTHDQRQWLTARLDDATVEWVGATPTVTTLGWDVIMGIGPAGTPLDGLGLDREFVRMAHGGSEISALVDAVHKLDGILVALSIAGAG